MGEKTRRLMPPVNPIQTQGVLCIY